MGRDSLRHLAVLYGGSVGLGCPRSLGHTRAVESVVAHFRPANQSLNEDSGRGLIQLGEGLEQFLFGWRVLVVSAKPAAKLVGIFGVRATMP